MPLSKHIGAYEDIRAILNAAIAAGGARFKPRNAFGQPDPKSVTYWIARANRFRSLLRRTGDSAPYEPLSFTPDGTVVRISVRPPLTEGDLTDELGNPIALTESTDSILLSEDEAALLASLRELDE